MLNVNVALFAKTVVQQRRFKALLLGLIGLSLLLGLAVVPIEGRQSGSLITTWFDGIAWSVITITGVGSTHDYPLTIEGRIIGMVLAGVGVLAYSLIVSMFSLALSETKDRYYRKKTFEQLESIEKKLEALEKKNEFVVRNEIKP